MSRYQQYDESQLDANRIARYAVKVAASLRGRSEAPQHGDGGGPGFWVVGARRERGVFRVGSPDGGGGPRGWMSGDSIVLLEDGRLNYAEWHEEPLYTPWVVTDFRDVGDLDLIMLDYADHGRWQRVKPLSGEQHREELSDHYVLSVHARGVALSLGLKRLLDGSGTRMDGHLTGMQHRPFGP
jgi:hypothetical protein